MRTLRSTYALLALVLLVSGTAIIMAMRTTSLTFDEPVLIAAGARGYATGEWGMAPEHPPFMQYLYGFLPHLTDPKLPNESGVRPEQKIPMGYRYRYAEFFFFNIGNNPERLAFLGRLPAALCALALAFLAFAFTRRYYGDRAGLLAAALVAFLPDVLAHGGVAYNDVPIALAYFAGLWLLDQAIRNPNLVRALAAGVACGLALGVKNSAVALAPAGVLLLAVEALQRRGDRGWWKDVSIGAIVALAGVYFTLVLIYLGDFTLTEWRYAIGFVFKQVTATRAPSYLLGSVSTEGFWYYFPVAFLYKTSLGFHALLVLAIWYFARHVRSVRQVLGSPLRVPLIGTVVFGALLLRSQLNIGFRYALPMLPLLAVIVAVGAARLWESERRLRAAIVAATVWLIVHPLSYYPNFLTYVSEYGPGRSRNYEVFADSSLDWGQGLLLLRDYMRENRIDRIYLSYFGSAWPRGYGIEYVPLYSFFDLPNLPAPPDAKPPQYAAIAATNLTGTYFRGDPFAQFRQQKPERVLGNSIYIYRLAP